MSQMIQRGDEIIRINPNDNRELQAGRLNSCNYYNWQTRCIHYGEAFYELLLQGNRIIAETSSGMQHSDNGGYNWQPGC